VVLNDSELRAVDRYTERTLLVRIAERIDQYRGLLALVVVLAIWLSFPPRMGIRGRAIYPTLDVQRQVFFERASYGILGAGMTLVILTGGIDLSVGSVLGMTAMIFSIFLIWWDWNPVLAIVVSLGAASLAGAVNGVLVARFKMQPFAATLAMMVFARGVAKIVSRGEKVQSATDPQVFLWIATTPIVGRIVFMALLFPAVAIVLWIIARHTKFGRYLYAIGSNEEAARIAGIPVVRCKIIAYALCGLTAGIAGICNASRMRLGNPEAGVTYELDAIAAVVIGGTSLMGGRGGVMLTFVGALIVGYIDKLLSFHGWETSERLMAKGVIIVVAVLFQGIDLKRVILKSAEIINRFRPAKNPDRKSPQSG